MTLGYKKNDIQFRLRLCWNPGQIQIIYHQVIPWHLPKLWVYWYQSCRSCISEAVHLWCHFLSKINAVEKMNFAVETACRSSELEIYFLSGILQIPSEEIDTEHYLSWIISSTLRVAHWVEFISLGGTECNWRQAFSWFSLIPLFSKCNSSTLTHVGFPHDQHQDPGWAPKNL